MGQSYGKTCVVQQTPRRIDDAAGKISKPPPQEHKIYIKEEELLKKKEKELSWIKSVRSDVNKRRGRGQASSPCTIFKVPDYIRLCNKEAYDPLVVYIGPYHHGMEFGSSSTIIAMEQHKWLCLRRLLFRHRSRCSATDLLDRCLLTMKEMDADIRSCYSDPRSFHYYYSDANSLASSMLRDGCFILHLLLKQQHPEKKLQVINMTNNIEEETHEVTVDKDGSEILFEHGEGDEKTEEEEDGPLQGTLWIENLVLYDLLKLENQIPFFVLTTLFDLLKAPGDEEVDLVKLTVQLFSEIMHPSSISETPCPILPSADKVHHLLHLFYSTLLPSDNQQQADVSNSQGVKTPEWIPSATELHQAGVKFVKKKNASSFLDVSFKNGRMEIPELCLYDYTDTLFRNLIAFEQCYPDTRTHITIYAAFMDCIIDTPRDARLLHLNGILSNRLSTDEAAADLFNKLCNKIHYASDRNYLHKLFVDVNEYHNSRWNIWRSKLMGDYFGNPWSIISLIAAVVLLLLTIEQSFFAAYSYFRPS